MDNLKKSIEDNISFRNQLQDDSQQLDYSLVEKYISFFNFIDETNTSIVIVQDLIKNEIVYVSQRFFKTFGFIKTAEKETDHIWFREHLHPNDYIINISGIKTVEFLKDKPIEKRKDYKLIHDFRIKNDFGKWIRLLVQDYMLEFSENGYPWINLKLFDLSPMQDLNKSAYSMCREISSGETIFTLEGKPDFSDQISERETQVLELVAKGMRSKEIANELYISENTVNNHRRNVIKKLNVSNTSEALTLCLKMGLI